MRIQFVNFKETVIAVIVIVVIWFVLIPLAALGVKVLFDYMI